nr:hypothetical protein [Novosphingobium sp. BW1]
MFADIFEREEKPFVQAIFDRETSAMVRGNLALIGDAGFVARPHTAMGVAKAAGDAFALAKAIDQGWSKAARRMFETERLASGRAIVAYGRRLGSRLDGPVEV